MQIRSVEVSSIMNESGVSFGTSGVRGLVENMSEFLCYCYTLSFAKALNLENGNTVAIAIDLRPSSPIIAAACIAALKHLNIEVEFCGEIPTPALAYYAQLKNIPAIMVTGSHIPFDRNGIKFYSEKGEITKEEELIISNGIVNVDTSVYTYPLPAINPLAKKYYLDRYTEFLPTNIFKGLKLAFYEHSSVARDLLTDLLRSLGATVISLGRTDQFVPIDTEAVSRADIDRAKEWASLNNFDAIFSTDGDGDRPLIGDETGSWLRGDIVGLLTAEFLNADAIATPVSCNTAIELTGKFKHVVRTRIGSPYVIAAMKKLLDNPCLTVVGFEANGGFLQGSLIKNQNKELLPLCTRDAILPIIAVIALAKMSNSKISDLTKNLPKRITASDRIQNFPSLKSQELLTRLEQNNNLIDSLLGKITGKLKNIDTTDGLRMYFDNEEIIHFRPSGNAPELRCYAESTSQNRSETLVSESLKIINSI